MSFLKFIYNEYIFVEISSQTNWLNISNITNYRSYAHEFGHFAFGFGDEYIDTNEKAIDDGFNYGYMDWNKHFPDTDSEDSEIYDDIMSNKNKFFEYSSELSSYDRTNQNNINYTTIHNYKITGKMSCWDHLEFLIEKEYNDIKVEILKPSERKRFSGLNYIPGPNDYKAIDSDHGSMEINYDVGSLINFYPDNIDYGPVDLPIEIKKLNNDKIKNNAKIVSNVNGIQMYQGCSFKENFILLGVTTNDYIHITYVENDENNSSSNYYQIANKIILTNNIKEKKQFSDPNIQSDTEPLEIILEPVDYHNPIMTFASFDANGNAKKGMIFKDDITFTPMLDYSVNGSSVNEAYSFNDPLYSLQFPENMPGEGIWEMTLKDDHGNDFPVFFQYTMMNNYGGAHGPGGHASINTQNNDIEKFFIIQNDFMIIRDGISPAEEQAGDVYSIGAYPNPANFQGYLTISYLEGDLVNKDECKLRIHKWNEAAHQWELVGGTPNISDNSVTAKITSLGTYGLFTTETVKDRPEDDPILIDPQDKSEIHKYKKLQWENQDDAIYYIIEIAGSPDFTNVLYNTNSYENECRFYGLEEEHSYFWRVKASNICGETEWSETREFYLRKVVLADLNAPLVLDPSYLLSSPVSLWENQGYVDEDAVMDDEDRQPQLAENLFNGFPGLKFNAEADPFKSDALKVGFDPLINELDAFALYVVLKTPEDITSTQVIWESGNTKTGYNIYLSNGSIVFGMWNRTQRRFVTFEANPSETYVAKLKYDGQFYVASLNTVKADPVPFSGLLKGEINDNGIGASIGGTRFHNYNVAHDFTRFFDGAVAEVILSENPEEEDIVESYLNDKYEVEFPLYKQAIELIYEDEPEAETLPVAIDKLTVQPNPFTNQTTVHLTLQAKQHVRLEVTDAMGNTVLNIYNGELKEGTTEFKIDGHHLSSGVYILKAIGTNFIQNIKLVQIK